MCDMKRRRSNQVSEMERACGHSIYAMPYNDVPGKRVAGKIREPVPGVPQRKLILKPRNKGVIG